MMQFIGRAGAVVWRGTRWREGAHSASCEVRGVLGGGEEGVHVYMYVHMHVHGLVFSCEWV